MKVENESLNCLAIEYSLPELGEVASCILSIMSDEESHVFAFKGDLGAGKTTLIKELVRQLGVVGLVKSPTYAIQAEYEGIFKAEPILVAHWDLYRVSEAEAIEMFDEYASESSNKKRILFIEWAERLGEFSSGIYQVIVSDLDSLGASQAIESHKDVYEIRKIQLKCPKIDK